MLPVITAGTILANRFQIERLAGAGGMGAVYRAYDQLTGGPVALKLMHSHSYSPDESSRFAREAQLLASLRHPGIVSYVAHGITPQGARFLAMEWLEGEDLAHRLQRGPLPLSSAISLLRRVAEALAFAHDRGILHRDLKPTNLFLPDGAIEAVKILDFGIARRLSSSRAMTKTGAVLGTPEYMAPEQARGARHLTAAVDLFSLGCVLYECLVGEPPFAGEHFAAVLVRILCEEPAAPSERRPGIPEAMNVLVRRLLAKDPARRPASAADVAQALDGFGELAELPLLPTMPQSVRVESVATMRSEQTLLSLVMAHAPSAAATEELHGQTPEAAADSEQHQALIAELQSLGAEVSVLLGGALVIRVQPTGNAQDQVAQAARLALLLAERWAEARIAVVTGRGRLSQGLVTGEAIDRAWRLLTRTPSQPAGSETAVLPRIFVDEVSAGLLDGRFELQRCGNDGFALGGERVEADTERRLLGKPTPCVGRERELSTLEGVLAECRDDSVARAVLVLAPPGMGKSRLRHEFLRREAGRGKPLLKLQGRGDPMKIKASYGLLGEALRGLCGVTPRQTATEQQEALLGAVRRHVPATDTEGTTEFLGELCGVHFSDANHPRLRAARQDPYIMSDQVERAWLRWLRSVASEQPVLLLLEDLHWADALTVKLIHAALHYVSEHALMVLALARPEVQDLYPNLWGGLPLQLPLNPLPKKASERLVRQILGSSEDQVEVARVVDQAAGNPLFLEELIRAVAERQSGVAPATVMAILQARIGRLSLGARRTLRAASVYGQAFTEPGVRSLLSATQKTDQLRNELDELLHEEMIEQPRERRSEGPSEYAFHHSLMRDAAYGLLSPEEQVAWHAAAGLYLESLGNQSPVQLAEHFRLGGDHARAVQQFRRAAEQASEACDLDTALACVEGGLGCGAAGKARGELLALRIAAWLYKERFVETLRDGPEALALLTQGSNAWCRVFTALFPAAALVEGKQLPALMETFLATTPDVDARATYVHGAAMLSVMCGIMGQRLGCHLARARAKELCPLLDRRDHNALGSVLGADANWYEQVIKLPYTNLQCNQNASAELLAAGNRPARGAFGVYLGKAWFDLGQPEQAQQALRAHIELAETMQSATPLAYSRTYLARVLAASTDPQAQQEAENLAQLVLAGHNASMVGLAHGVLAQVSLARGDLERAESEAQIACAALLYFPPYRSDISALHAQILRAQGKTAPALAVCEAALQEYRSLDLEPYGLLLLYAELSACRLASGDAQGAQAAVLAALPVLERRTADIPDPTLAADYLRRVVENAQLLQWAQKWQLPLPPTLAAVAPA